MLGASVKYEPWFIFAAKFMYLVAVLCEKATRAGANRQGWRNSQSGQSSPVICSMVNGHVSGKVESGKPVSIVATFRAR